MKFLAWRTGETRGKPMQTPFRPPRNPHGLTEMRTRGRSCGTRASNFLGHGVVNWKLIKENIYVKVHW